MLYGWDWVPSRKGRRWRAGEDGRSDELTGPSMSDVEDDILVGVNETRADQSLEQGSCVTNSERRREMSYLGRARRVDGTRTFCFRSPD